MSTVIYPAPIFGPVTSRRLGRSLGVNLLPPDGKLCSFDCLYCECGLNEERRPRAKMTPGDEVLSALEVRLAAMQSQGETLDAVTFSGNGEPTSHPDFLEIVRGVKRLRDRYFPMARVCLLTNATHLDRPEVFAAVQELDKACLKLDTVNAAYIRLVDRPNAHYDVDEVLSRMKTLSGKCFIQTMFLKGTWQGKNLDNTGPEYVDPWIEAVCAIRPLGVDLYTVSRETPVAGLQKVSREELEAIAERLRARGIDAHTYG